MWKSVWDSTRLGASQHGTYTISGVAHSVVGRLGGGFVRFAYDVRVPIQGWSGAQVVQQGSRYLWAQRYATSATRVTAAPAAQGQYRALNTAVDVAPTTGPSVVDAIRIDGAPAAGRMNEIQIYVGPNKVVQLVGYGATGRTGDISLGFYSDDSPHRGVTFGYNPTTGVARIAAATAASSVAGYTLSANGSAVAAINPAYFDLLIADDPVPVAQSQTVYVEASSDAGQVCTAGATNLQYEDESYDTHGSWNGTVFTAPLTGVYAATACTGLNTYGHLVLYKNGAPYAAGGPNVQGAGGYGVQAIAASVRLIAGEAISFRYHDNNTTRNTLSWMNRVTIIRIGDF